MGQLINARPIVDGNGNINVHGRAGLSLTYQMFLAGVAQDIHAAALFFEISPATPLVGTRVALGVDSGDHTIRTIIIEPTVIAALPLNTQTPFALRDETADPAIVRWDGFLTVRGYETQPA